MKHVNPFEDGDQHVNIHCKSKSQLGRMLSPPYSAQFELPEHGTFESVGGYWCWLVFDREDGFRNLSGDDVLVRQDFDVESTVNTESFQRKILHATWQKIRQNHTILWRFEQNILPFRRYMLVENEVYVPSDASWLTDGIDVMQDYMDQNIW